MITYPYKKLEHITTSIFPEVKKYLENEHELKKQKNKALANTRRRIKEEDIKIIVNEYFKDFAIWLQDPYTNIYDLGDLGYLKLNHRGIDSFLNKTLIPKYKTSNPDNRNLTKRRIKYLWRLRQLRYLGDKDKKEQRKENKRKLTQYKINKITPELKEPDYLYGDLFDIKIPKIETRLLANALSANLDRKQFLDIIDTNQNKEINKDKENNN
jgi:hypothetical protein